MSLTDKPTRERVRDLNDAFRKTLDPTLGLMMLTAGVNALPSDVRAMATGRSQRSTPSAPKTTRTASTISGASTSQAASSFSNSTTTTPALKSARTIPPTQRRRLMSELGQKGRKPIR
jgi:hypothetical protein